MKAKLKARLKLEITSKRVRQTGTSQMTWPRMRQVSEYL